MTNEDGYATLVDGCRHGLSAFVVPAGVVVVPATFATGQIGFPLGHARLGDGTHQKRRSEHILIRLAQGLGVVGEVEHQGAHQRIAFFSNDRQHTYQQYLSHILNHQFSIYKTLHSQTP